jgi:hypothetical protein
METVLLVLGKFGVGVGLAYLVRSKVQSPKSKVWR